MQKITSWIHSIPMRQVSRQSPLSVRQDAWKLRKSPGKFYPKQMLLRSNFENVQALREWMKENSLYSLMQQNKK